MLAFSLASAACLLGLTYAQNSSVVSIPYELTYRLPPSFQGNLGYTFENGTQTSNDTINELLRSASQAPFVAYDPEFLDIIGSNPELQLIEKRPGDFFAFESGVWVPSTNEVWFTSSSSQAPTNASILNLETNEIRQLKPSIPIINYNGAYLYNGQVTFGSFRDNDTWRGGVFNVDVKTHEATMVLNSYFGLEFSGIDDPVWVRRGNKDYLFFDDLDFIGSSTPYTNPGKSPLPRGVWRFDPQEQLLNYVISRTDIALPNGLRVSPDQSTLYVTDFGTTDTIEATSNSHMASPAIYKFDLDDDVMPVNKRVFSLVRDGGADGLHIDDAGRLWTGEASGITVRSPAGKVLGSFNSQQLLVNQSAEALSLANFALAGDTLIILAVDRLYRVKLAQTVVSADSSIVNK